MGDNGGSDGGDRPDNQIDVVVDGPPKSPWKTSAAASPVMAADSESWPALSDAQQRPKHNGSINSNSAKSPPLPTLAETDGCGDPPASPAPVGAVSLLVIVNSILFYCVFCECSRYLHLVSIMCVGSICYHELDN